jgi:hypothetical protein
MCARDNIACVCAEGPVAMCVNCGLAPSFDGWDECVACGTAALLVEDPGYIDFAREHFAGTESLRQLEREWDRQLSAIIECGKVAA